MFTIDPTLLSNVIGGAGASVPTNQVRMPGGATLSCIQQNDGSGVCFGGAKFPNRQYEIDSARNITRATDVDLSKNTITPVLPTPKFAE